MGRNAPSSVKNLSNEFFFWLRANGMCLWHSRKLPNRLIYGCKFARTCCINISPFSSIYYDIIRPSQKTSSPVKRRSSRPTEFGCSIEMDSRLPPFLVETARSKAKSVFSSTDRTRKLFSLMRKR